MSDSKMLLVQPIVHYPRVAEVGKTYLMTIDLQPEEDFKWEYEEEEYPIYCTVDSHLFSSKPVGEPVIVLHRFGGSYGEAKFLLTAVTEEIHGKIQITLINRWGVATKVINLEQVRVVNEKFEDPNKSIFTFSNFRLNSQEADTRRSLKLSRAGKAQVERALTDKKWTTEDLAAATQVTRSTVTYFRVGKAVARKNFVMFCEALGLDWLLVSEESTDARKRSLKLSPTGKNQVEQALTNRKWTTENLAAAIGVQRATATNFRVGKKPIDRKKFVKFCEALGLDWQLVSEDSIAPSESPIAQSPSPSQSEETRIERVREHCRQRILSQHSRMRLLSGEEIGVDQLYVDVWLLNRSPRTFQVSESKLLETFDLRNDRLGLGDRIKRSPSFEVANSNPNLVILGKPGSGKTTFLKHLAVDWCNGKFQPESIAVLIELRRIRNGQWNLIEMIGKELGLEDRQRVVELLKQSKLLVLMDGLDEVPTNQLRHDVQNQLEQIFRDYPKNRFVLTCRTQIMGAIPVGFTSVEVADFNEEQVRQFVQNWFVVNGQSSTEALQRWESFDLSIKHHPALRELTATPVLLSLICLVLHDEGEIPVQRDRLYRQGIKLLLSKWNDDKQIDGWEIGTETYRQLNTKQKEALLTEIAVRKFGGPGNFALFQQDEVVTQINEFLQLTDFRDGVAVLKAIEAQHGLLIERADEIYSFSHLTFQQYFAARYIAETKNFSQLIQHMLDMGWREVALLTCNILDNSDTLLILMKAQIDQMIQGDERLQLFLTWVDEQAKSANSSYSLTATRAFYFAFAQEIPINNQICFKLDTNFYGDFESSHNVAYGYFSRPDEISYKFVSLLFMNKFTNGYFNSIISTMQLPDQDYLPDSDDHNFWGRCIAPPIDTANIFTSQSLKIMPPLQYYLPKNDSATAFFWHYLDDWWSLNGESWVEQITTIMMEHCSLGQDWQFTDSQKQQLQQYYVANELLVDCMVSDCYLSREVRENIEKTLFLPTL